MQNERTLQPPKITALKAYPKSRLDVYLRYEIAILMPTPDSFEKSGGS